MRKVGTLTFVRAVFAVIAVLVIAVPSFVYALGPISGYPAPLYAAVIGQGTVSPGTSSTPYTLYVEFVDGTHTTLAAPQVVFSVTPNVGAMNTMTGIYTAPITAPNPPRVAIQGSATFTTGGVVSSRIILIQ